MKIKEIRVIRPLAVFALRVCTVEKLKFTFLNTKDTTHRVLREGNEGGLSDDCGGLFSIILNDGQKEVSTLSHSETFVYFAKHPAGCAPLCLKSIYRFNSQMRRRPSRVSQGAMI